MGVILGAVMLPSLILAYFGFRYIRQEEVRQSQLVVENLRVALTNAVSEVDKEISGRVEATFDSLASLASPSVSVNTHRLRLFAAHNEYAEEVFLLSRDLHVVYPRTFRSQVKAPTMEEILGSPSLEEHLIKGEQYEARGNISSAIEEFSSGLKAAPMRRARLAFLVRIGRCQYKSNKFLQARQTYEQVLVEDGHRFWGEGSPYHIAAAVNLAQIAAKQGNTETAIDVLAGLYGDLLGAFDRFDRRTFQYYLQKVKSELESYHRYFTLPVKVRVDSLSKVEQENLEEPNRRENLRRRIVPLVEAAVRATSKPNVLQFASAGEQDSLHQFAFVDRGEQSQGIRIVGIAIPVSALINSIHESVNKIRVGTNLRIALLSRDGEISEQQSKGGKTTLLEEPLSILAGTMAGYKLAMVAPGGTRMEELASRSLTLYYVLIAAIVVVIAMGGVFVYLESARERELTQLKSDFLSNVTHDIKTPIATIRALAENVNEGWVKSSERQRHYFHVIGRESERLGHLVEKTLDFSRIESGRKKYRMEQVSAREVVDNAVERFRTLTDGQDVAITCEIAPDLPTLSMDEVAIGQALLNLLENAVKYSPEKKTVVVKASVADEHLAIAVSDRGVGMDKSEISRIFEKFYRSESPAGRKVSGSGVGLTIVKDAVEAHEGHIEVVSKRNEGSTFTIILPLEQKGRHADNPPG